MNQKKREEKNGIWLKRLGPIGLCQVQEVEELQKELSEAECKIKLGTGRTPKKKSEGS